MILIILFTECCARDSISSTSNCCISAYVVVLGTLAQTALEGSKQGFELFNVSALNIY